MGPDVANRLMKKITKKRQGAALHDTNLECRHDTSHFPSMQPCVRVCTQYCLLAVRIRLFSSTPLKNQERKKPKACQSLTCTLHRTTATRWLHHLTRSPGLLGKQFYREKFWIWKRASLPTACPMLTLSLSVISFFCSRIPMEASCLEIKNLQGIADNPTCIYP